jgi:aldose 1-epimerase
MPYMTTIQKTKFGEFNGSDVQLYTLKNEALEISITPYGGIITHLKAPDKNGKLEDVVLGYNDLNSYVKNNPYFGCLVGRFGNRINQGKFKLNSVEYRLACNENNTHHLHGGLKGFDKVLWSVKDYVDDAGAHLELSYLSPDGEEGYPGNLSVKVIYTLKGHSLTIDYFATADKDTPVNLTQHTYFNLSEKASDILGHELRLEANNFTPVDKTLIPVNKIQSVSGTPMDFTKSTVIGQRIDNDYDQLKFAGGYDHNWVLNSQDGSLALAATVYESNSGRVLEVLTTEPGIQFYAGNFLDGSITGKHGVYKKRYGFCLETQHYPDSPNQPSFPSTVLKPGGEYRHTTEFRFSTK